MFRNLIFIILILTIFGCKHTDTPKESTTPEELYSEANKALQNKDYKKSSELFSKITYEFPYYSRVNKAHVMEIYSYYLMKDYDNVVFSTENYIKTYPTSSNIPYTYYLKALSYYDQIDNPHRDQSITQNAKNAFTEVIARFPNSKYAKDARTRLKLIEDHLAAHEMIIGRYYLNKGEISAAIERFKTIVSNYSTTSQIEEALYRLVEAYAFLGIKDEAQKHAAVLGHNYPNSKWYKLSYSALKK